MKKTIQILFIFVGMNGTGVFADVSSQVYNVVAFFPTQNDSNAITFNEALEKEASQHLINRFTSHPDADGGITFCIQAGNAGNQYRILEFAKTKVDDDQGAWARPSYKPCD